MDAELLLPSNLFSLNFSMEDSAEPYRALAEPSSPTSPASPYSPGEVVYRSAAAFFERPSPPGITRQHGQRFE